MLSLPRGFYGTVLVLQNEKKKKKKGSEVFAEQEQRIHQGWKRQEQPVAQETERIWLLSCRKTEIFYLPGSSGVLDT